MPVGSFAPNAFGLHDVHENVWEWVQACYGSYGNAPNDGRASVGGDCSDGALRGCSWGGRPGEPPLRGPLLEQRIEATYPRQRERHLANANLGLEELRFLCRLARDLRCLDNRRYEHAARSLDGGDEYNQRPRGEPGHLTQMASTSLTSASTLRVSSSAWFPHPDGMALAPLPRATRQPADVPP